VARHLAFGDFGAFGNIQCLSPSADPSFGFGGGETA
jgi:hypothetical protein